MCADAHIPGATFTETLAMFASRVRLPGAGRGMLLAACLCVALPPTASAQLPAPVDSALHTIFASRTYASERFGPARWSADGDHYLTVEPSPDVRGGFDIVEYGAEDGARHVKVSARQLVPAGREAPLVPENYAFSPDGRRALVFTNTRRVWRQNTRGDYWVLNLGTGALHQVGGARVPEASLMFAKFSPDGSKVAYVRNGDLYVEPADGGTATRLTRDASHTLVNGMSDWVYEEEFSLRDGFHWSPDSKAIAFWQFDMSGVRDFLLLDVTDSLYPFTIPVQYPKAGTTNSAVRVGVVAATGGAVTWMRVPGDPRQNYIPWMEWAAPGQLLVQHMNRKQDRDDVLLADAKSGAVRTVMTETDSAWVDLNDDVPWVNGGRSMLWLSERDGWRHVYEVPRDGGSARLLTPGAYDVEGIAAVDEPGGWLYVIASPENATQRYLYRVSLRTPGAPERVTPAGDPGWNAYDFAPNARWALHTRSTFDTPPVTDLVRLPDHAVVRTLVKNDALREAAARAEGKPVEFFTVSLHDGATLDGWLIRPRDFDPARKYPILVQVYGEPAAQTVTDRWGGSGMLWHRMLADQGYLVVSFDNRGTPAPKGRAWRKVIHGAVGVLSSQEQADAVRVFARTHPFADSTRVAIWGWSGGGSSTLNAMFRYPDVYQVGMSVAPVADQRLYDTIYQERYMGTPQDNPDGYRMGSPINFAEGLKGKLLVVHGTGDDNVHFQGTARLINRLVALDKPFDVMVYPNRTHCICEGPGTTLHLYSLLTRYLLANLPAGGR
ncbi:MAG TPA: S9 family peptidase [Gemmatimonadaceae bacterium]|nr:S9 family peptidase [Gemmatimonadaceae bacterium]